MGKRNATNRPWDKPGYHKTALAQLMEEWHNHTGETHVR